MGDSRASQRNDGQHPVVPDLTIFVWLCSFLAIFLCDELGCLGVLPTPTSQFSLLASIVSDSSGPSPRRVEAMFTDQLCFSQFRHCLQGQGGVPASEYLFQLFLLDFLFFSWITSDSDEALASGVLEWNDRIGFLQSLFWQQLWS